MRGQVSDLVRYAQGDFALRGEFLSQRWERNQRIAGGRLRMGTSVPIFALPPVPCLRGPLLRSSAKFPARKIRVTSAIPPGPLGPGFAKIAAGAVPHQRLAWPSKRPGAYSGGSPKGLPYPIQKEFLENRRGGVCPSRGPASVRPLRKRREGFCDRRRDRPPEPSPFKGEGGTTEGRDG